MEAQRIYPPTKTTTGERKKQRRVLEKKKTFWQHVTVYALMNTAFWVSWIIGGVTDMWLAPWPLLPTIVWGIFILAYEYQLGGPEAIRHETMAREAHQLRHPDEALYQQRAVQRPITFGNFSEYSPVPKFRWREVIDARDLTSIDEKTEETTSEAANAG